MADYAPPSGPPPPKVPEGWKAVYSNEYNTWFFVNIYTKQSTWEQPTEPAPRPGNEGVPSSAPPPSYQSGPNAPHVSDDKKTPLDSNNPYGPGGPGNAGRETDEEMARRLQREEQERSGGQGYPTNPGMQSGDRGYQNSYYNSAPQQQPVQQGYLGAPGSGYGGTSPGGTQKRSSGGGLFGKLKDKLGSAGGSSGFGPKPGQYGQQGYPQQGYGGYPQQHYGQPQYGHHGPMGGMMGHGMMGSSHKKKAGLGVGGAAALGVGGGLLGGAMLANAMDDDHDYAEGYQDGAGDFGGGDMGDFGGGDF